MIFKKIPTQEKNSIKKLLVMFCAHGDFNLCYFVGCTLTEVMLFL